MLSDRLASWLHIHKGKFIAYPVINSAIHTVLTTGLVKTLEQKIRDLKHLTEEQVNAEDEHSQKIWHFIKQIKRENKLFPPVVSLIIDARLDFTHALCLDLVDKDIYSVLAKNKPASLARTLSDGKTITLHRTRNSDPMAAYEVMLASLPWPACTNNVARAHYSVDEQIAIDSLAEEPIDYRLSRIWQAWSGSCNQYKLFTDLIAFRAKELIYSGKGKELRAVFNTVPWQQGNVFILRGTPRKILSAGNFKQNMELTNGQEVALLSPFENEGKPLSLALADPDTILLGSEEALAPFFSSFAQRNINYCTFEAMTAEQLHYLAVPLRLYPKNAPTSLSCAAKYQQPKQLEALHNLSLFSEQRMKKAIFELWKAGLKP